ncbi:hypothetical protein A9P82_04190 [Arachidicoccus ginsenosidimutans]|uniref:YHS domain-containing protein n=1 Tax=Arachidicoccus sp. BS20 TaxID=1850526 RepID=UPI0007F0BE5B|nr:YHS domain-containing protein [Arachidicoccus sp. BS20]ANI88563.1 hypothetical protein A9P82_04190 [Arachidicoccus sp. BS20]
MKKLVSIVAISASLVIAASCNNSSSTKIEDVAATKKAMPAKKDSAKYTLSMVDNKKDFVCRMPLTAGIGDTVHYKGKVYGFCSKGCKESFLEDPESYLKEKL